MVTPDLWVKRDFGVIVPIEMLGTPLLDGPCSLELRRDGRVILQHYVYRNQRGTFATRTIKGWIAYGIGPEGGEMVWLLPNGGTCTTSDLERIMDRLAWFAQYEVAA